MFNLTMIKEYLKRILSIFYCIINKPFFNFLNLKATLFFSVRVQGKKYITIGANSVIQRGGWLLATKCLEVEPELIIGDRCSIGDYCHITAIKSVVLENDVLLANNVYIADNSHQFIDINIPIQEQEIIYKGEVRLKTGCWIGENVCIMGASIGKNSVIGANSTVLHDIDDFCVAVGSPARVIKRFDHIKKEWVKVN